MKVVPRFGIDAVSFYWWCPVCGKRLHTILTADGANMEEQPPMCPVCGAELDLDAGRRHDQAELLILFVKRMFSE